MEISNKPTKTAGHISQRMYQKKPIDYLLQQSDDGKPPGA
jgi:hypothetical protein